MALKELLVETEVVVGPEQIGVNQLKAADNVYAAIHTLKEADTLPDGLDPLLESNIYQLRRGLCLPSSSATCINKAAGFRLIGDTEGFLTVGDMYMTMMPHHGYRDGVQTANMPKGWLSFTSDGFFYYHAISAFSRAVGVEAQPIQGFNSLNDLNADIDEGHAFAVSLDNNFVIDHTLKDHPELIQRNDGETSILIEGENGLGFHKFAHSRHVVAIMGREGDNYKIFDPFQLPQMKVEESFLTLPAEAVDPYLSYSTPKPSQGIIFSNGNPSRADRTYGYEHVVPEEVVNNVRGFVDKKLGIVQ